MGEQSSLTVHCTGALEQTSSEEKTRILKSAKNIQTVEIGSKINISLSYCCSVIKLFEVKILIF